jgi:hypothetical protein
MPRKSFSTALMKVGVFPSGFDLVFQRSTISR